jgi:hypothetical protein
MAFAPQIALRDGSGFTQTLTFTTNQESIFILGQVDVSTADIQVSIRAPSSRTFSLRPPQLHHPQPGQLPDRTHSGAWSQHHSHPHDRHHRRGQWRIGCSGHQGSSC